MSKKFNIHDWQAKRRKQRLNEEVALDDYSLEPEGMDDPDEDLVIIGSGYLDIKSNFKERPPQTNGEYAEIGQKVVDQLHNGDKEAALDFIYSKINETKNAKKDVSESLNPEVSRSVDKFITAMADKYDYSMQDAVYAIMAALKQRNYDGLGEHHNDEDFPGKDLSAWDLLDKIKAGNEDLYNKVEDFMKSMKEMSSTGTGASVSAGAGEAFATPNAFKKKRK